MADKMTKAILIKTLAEKTELTKRQITDVLDVLVDLSYKEIKKNAEVTIPGFGKIIKRRRKARNGRNPLTGETIKIPAKDVLKFRFAKAAKDATCK
jgi:DNA-binding protein HU-beta